MIKKIIDKVTGKRRDAQDRPQNSDIKLNLIRVPQLLRDINYTPNKNEYSKLNLSVYQHINDIPLARGETILSGGHVTPLVSLGLCAIQDIRFVNNTDENSPEKIAIVLVVSSGDLIKRGGNNTEKVNTIFSNLVSELGQVLTKIEYVDQLTALYPDKTNLPERMLALKIQNTARVKMQYPTISAFFNAKKNIILKDKNNATLQALIKYEQTIARIYAINKDPRQRFTPDQLISIK